VVFRLIAEAKEREFDVSRIAGQAIADVVRVEKYRRWKEENRAALERVGARQRLAARRAPAFLTPTSLVGPTSS